ncbi:MAG: hypothetical protein IPN21_18900 [Burkholderiales bacterium]|nr:hypothetical protein [Burkholderiales bacterium]
MDLDDAGNVGGGVGTMLGAAGLDLAAAGCAVRLVPSAASSITGIEVRSVAMPPSPATARFYQGGLFRSDRPNATRSTLRWCGAWRNRGAPSKRR